MLELKKTIVAVAKDMIGEPTRRYVHGDPEHGNSSQTGFDCSGLVSYVLEKSGIAIPNYVAQDGSIRTVRHSNEFFDYFGVAVHEERAMPGDLIFFSQEGWTPSHVGILVSENEYVHAPGVDGGVVRIDEIEHTQIQAVERDYHRILYEHNPIGFKAPVVMHESTSYRVHQRVL